MVAVALIQRFLILVVLLSIVLADGLKADSELVQKDYCDPSLGQIADNPYGYRLRGDRCEGIYVKEVGVTTLLVVSLTDSFEDYDLNSPKPLTVEWTRPSLDGTIRLRAQGLRRRLYYRMDTGRPSSAQSYIWSPNLLAALNIQKKDIGIIGVTRNSIGTTERDVYVPLHIRQQGNGTHSGSYRLVLLPGIELQEIFISLGPVGQNGRPRAFLKEGEALGYGYYPAERGVEIPIAGLKAPGIYYLELGATLRGGGTSAVELWFHHPGG